MSLAISITDSLRYNLGEDEDTDIVIIGLMAQEATVKELHEIALRQEVYEIVSNRDNQLLGDFSMTHVHEILDAVIQVLEGVNVDA